MRFTNVLLYNKPRCPAGSKGNGKDGRSHGSKGKRKDGRSGSHKDDGKDSRSDGTKAWPWNGNAQPLKSNPFIRNSTSAQCRKELHVLPVLTPSKFPSTYNLQKRNFEAHYVMSEAFLQWSKRTVGQERGFPSTGLLLLLAASRVCASVDLYGFDFYGCPNGSRHYYAEQKQKCSNQLDEPWTNHQWLNEELYVAKNYYGRCKSCKFDNVFSTVAEHASVVSELKHQLESGRASRANPTFNRNLLGGWGGSNYHPSLAFLSNLTYLSSMSRAAWCMLVLGLGFAAIVVVLLCHLLQQARLGVFLLENIARPPAAPPASISPGAQPHIASRAVETPNAEGTSTADSPLRLTASVSPYSRQRNIVIYPAKSFGITVSDDSKGMGVVIDALKSGQMFAMHGFAVGDRLLKVNGNATFAHRTTIDLLVRMPQTQACMAEPCAWQTHTHVRTPEHT